MIRRIRNKKTEETNEEDNANNNDNVEDVINEEVPIDEKNIVSIKNAYKIFITFLHFLLRTLIAILKVSSIYLLWICLHYFSAHLYIKFCVPDTIIGFLMSPFMIATPHCQGLRWIVYNAAGIINNMWILIGTWIYSMIWIFKTNNHTEQSNF
jgi:hypothetical protein